MILPVNFFLVVNQKALWGHSYSKTFNRITEMLKNTKYIQWTIEDNLGDFQWQSFKHIAVF